MEQLRAQVAMAAPSNGRVLISGENGTGKELVARQIHALSHRHNGPFVEVNCAAIPEELIESELFGHARGAFTGAVADRRGKFEIASGGTLFLDEVGDMSLKTQAKVLRALQEQVVEPVGGQTERASGRARHCGDQQGPAVEIRHGRFREDLYFRLNVIPICRAAAAGARRRHRPAGRAFRRGVLAGVWPPAEDVLGRGAGHASGISLARQRPGAAQHDRAADDHGARRGHCRRIWRFSTWARSRREPRRQTRSGRCSRRATRGSATTSWPRWARSTATSPAPPTLWASSEAISTRRCGRSASHRRGTGKTRKQLTTDEPATNCCVSFVSRTRSSVNESTCRYQAAEAVEGRGWHQADDFALEHGHAVARRLALHELEDAVRWASSRNWSGSSTPGRCRDRRAGGPSP